MPKENIIQHDPYAASQLYAFRLFRGNYIPELSKNLRSINTSTREILFHRMQFFGAIAGKIRGLEVRKVLSPTPSMRDYVRRVDTAPRIAPIGVNEIQQAQNVVNEVIMALERILQSGPQSAPIH